MNANRNRLELRHRQVGPWGLNAYALVCPHSRHSLLIDPGAQPDTLTSMLEGTFVQAMLITHGHPDHTGALEAMRERLNIPVWTHPACRSVAADAGLGHLDAIGLGRFNLTVYHTPGHTPDQICVGVNNDNRYIVGDTIFDGGPGKTWSAEDFRQTLATLDTVVLTWPDDAICYPGHGPSFVLGDKKAAIKAFLAKDHGRFYGDAVWEMR